MIIGDGQVLKVLRRLQISIANENNDEIQALCPGHELRTGKQDNSPSWSINTSSGLHNCFSCGYKGNLLTLIAEQKDLYNETNALDIKSAASWVKNNSSLDLDLIQNLLTNSTEVAPAPMRFVDESELAVYDFPPDWAIENRNLNTDAAWKVLLETNVRWDSETSSWILPIYYRNDNTNNLLIGWQEKGERTRHFRNRPVGVPKGKALFGIANKKTFDEYNYANPNKPAVVIVESPLDAVRGQAVLRGTVPHMVMATYGATITNEQYKFIISNFDEVVFALDNPKIDAAGKVAVTTAYEKFRKYGLPCSFFNYKRVNPEAKDFGDMTDDEIRVGVQNPVHTAFGLSHILDY
jgi:hypothetical protein